MNFSSVNSARSLRSSKRRSGVSDDGDGGNSTASVVAETIKQSGNVFVGTYLERRYVYNIQAYRDIVIIEDDEEELIKCLETIKQTVYQEYGSGKWLGITRETRDDETKYHCLWVELENVPLGTHWFQLRSIEVKGETIQLQLKYLRTCRTNEHRLTQIFTDLQRDYKSIFTIENTQSALKFLAVVVMSLLGALCNTLWYVGDYSLKLTHELTGLVHALTPIMFGVMDFFSKCVSGFLWLIYVLWRGDSMPVARPPLHQPYVRYAGAPMHRPAIRYGRT